MYISTKLNNKTKHCFHAAVLSYFNATSEMHIFKITSENFTFIVHQGFWFWYFGIFLIIVRIFVVVHYVRFALRASWGVSVSTTHTIPPTHPPTQLCATTATLNLNFFCLIFIIYGEVTLDSVWSIISGPSIIVSRQRAGVRAEKARGAFGYPVRRIQCKPTQLYFNSENFAGHQRALTLQAEF